MFTFFKHTYAHTTGVDPKFPFFVEELQQDLGYETHLIGKWHCGHAKNAYLPTSRGFDSFFGLLGGGFHHERKRCAMNSSTLDLWNGTNLLSHDDKRLDRSLHATDLFADEASKIVKSTISKKKQDRKPLFLMLSYTAVHDPLVTSETYVKPCSHLPTRRRREMCAMMYQLDQGTKRVVESFESYDNLIILFMSDNGGFTYGGGLNYPLRGAKTGVFEGGIRTPAFLRLPRKFSSLYSDLMGQSLSDTPVHVTDIAPTLLALASNNTIKKKYDGKNILSSSIQRDRPIVLQHDPYTNQSAYMEYPYKLILGSPGASVITTEPTSDFFISTDPKHSELNIIGREYSWYELHTIPEAMNDIVDDLGVFDHGRFTIIVYITVMYRAVLQDFFSSFPVRNFLLDPKYDEMRSSVKTRESCPWLEPNRHWLFDLSRDNSEMNNLAMKMPDRVQAMYDRFCAKLRQSNGIMIAGDSNLEEDVSFGPRSCGPFLSDDAMVFSGFRYFPTLAQKLVRLALLISFLFVVSTCCCIRFLCRRFRYRHGEKVKTT